MQDLPERLAALLGHQPTLLFSILLVSRNSAGVPLRTWDTVLGFICGTTTRRGLAVRAILQPGDYPTGQKITDAQMAALNIEQHAVCPTWNYTIRPRPRAVR